MAANYDAVVVGAGVNGLCLALNLAAAGWRTLVLEAAQDPGGQARSGASMLPGFQIHPHANYLSYAELIALQPHAACRAWTFDAVRPVAQHGLCFRDGRPPVLIYRRDHPRRTFASLARYSARDARTYERCKARADRLTGALASLYFAPPSVEAVSRYVQVLRDAYRGFQGIERLGHSSARCVIDRWFESEEVRVLFLRLVIEFFGDPDQPGGDVALLGHVLWLLGRRALPIGGMGVVPGVLEQAALRAGVEFRYGAEVTRVVVEGGSVRGIELRDGNFVAAATVASSLAWDRTLAALGGADAVAPAERADLERLDRARPSMIGSYGACLGAAPHYRSAAHDADIDRCAQVFIGLDSRAEVDRYLADLQAGTLPVPAGAVRVNSLWDTSQAPVGRHAAGADCMFPPALDAACTAEVARLFPAAFLAMWAEYAPDIEKAVLAQGLTLEDVPRSVLLREGAPQYRAATPGLYLCGASVHPGGGVHGACGVNASQVMMADRSAAHRARPPPPAPPGARPAPAWRPAAAARRDSR